MELLLNGHLRTSQDQTAATPPSLLRFGMMSTFALGERREQRVVLRVLASVFIRYCCCLGLTLVECGIGKQMRTSPSVTRKPKCQTGRKSKKTIQGPHKTTKQSTVVDCKITSTTGEKHFHDSPTKTRHPCKIYPRDCCYWAFLFDNLRWAVDKIYVICDSDQSVVECKVRFLELGLVHLLPTVTG
ncbi:hypothetical protein STEG23_037154 [Scotinomys teguina]